ncbi:MAG: lipid-A-disaccharide synthase [Elusimicrobia bacterium]|nr:lipid-A-disaccharide synthase [Elusimicrobiota bacterium]
MLRLLVSAGDPSGDLIASHLVREIKKQRPDVEIWALGGPELAATSDVFLEDLASRGLMGWLEPIRKLPFLANLNRRLRDILKRHAFDMVIPVDFYGFNIRLAAQAKKLGYPVVYYVSPQLWASRPGRIKRMKRLVDHVLCVFPFEPDFYKKHGLPATFVGHPIVELLSLEFRDVHAENVAVNGHRPASMSDRPRIGLLPGSRPGEIARHMDVLLKSWRLICEEFPQARGILYKRLGQERLYPSDGDLAAMGVAAEWGPAYQSRHACDLALCASGLASLENMVLGVPMVIYYGVRPAWLFHIVKRIVKTPFIGMPNILAGSEICRELPWAMNPENDARAARDMSAAAIELLKAPERLAALRGNLSGLADSLLPQGQSPRRAAQEAVFRLLGAKISGTQTV